MREEIDARYTIDPEQYNYKGCLDATMVAETKRAIGQVQLSTPTPTLNSEP